MIDSFRLPFWAVHPASLLLASTGIVALAWLFASRARTARWQRGIWQAVVIALLALLVGELSGADELLAAFGRSWWAGLRSAPVAASFSVDVGKGQPLAINEPAAMSEPPEDTAARSNNHAGNDERFTTGHAPVEISFVSPAPVVDRPPSSDVDSLITNDRTDPSIEQPSKTAPAPRTLATRLQSQMDGADVRPLRWCLVVWLGGIGLSLLHGVVRHGRLLWMVRHGRAVPAAFRGHVQFLARRLGIRREIAVQEMPGLFGPVAFGVWRPTIGLPAGFCRQHDQVEQDVMLTHELEHLAGRDPQWRIASDMMVALWWWQPLAWWARGRLRGVSEIVADEASLVLDNGPETLAACLVAMGRRLVRSRQLGWSGMEGGGFRSALGRRVERLLSLKDRTWRVPRSGWMTSAAFIFATILAAVALAGAAGTRRATWQGKGDSTMTIQQAWRRSLGSLALLAAFGPGNPAVADDERKPDVPPPPGAERKEVRPPAPPRDERRGQERPDRGAARDEGRRRDGGEDGRLDRLKRDAQRLRQEGKTDDAARVEKEFREALAKMLKYTLPQLPEDVRGKLQPKIEEYFKARDDGKFDDADRIENEAKEIIKPFEDKIVDPRKKIHHLRGAADNLRAAGMNDLAEKLSEQVRQLEQEFGLPPMPEGDRRDVSRGREGRGRDGRGPEDRGREGRGPDVRNPEDRGSEGRGSEGRGPERRGPEGDDGRRGDNRRDEGGRGDNSQQELVRVLRELRNDVENLRREVQELRQRGGR